MLLMAGVVQAVRADYQYLPFPPHPEPLLDTHRPAYLLRAEIPLGWKDRGANLLLSCRQQKAWNSLSPPFIQVHGVEFRHRHSLPLSSSAIAAGMCSFFTHFRLLIQSPVYKVSRCKIFFVPFPEPTYSPSHFYHKFRAKPSPS